MFVYFDISIHVLAFIRLMGKNTKKISKSQKLTKFTLNKY